MKAIPTGYKATHVEVYASSTLINGVDIFGFNQTTGATSSKGTGNTNATIDITDVTSGADVNICIKVSPAVSTILIYGADITITAV